MPFLVPCIMEGCMLRGGGGGNAGGGGRNAGGGGRNARGVGGNAGDNRRNAGGDGNDELLGAVITVASSSFCCGIIPADVFTTEAMCDAPVLAVGGCTLLNG